jgi:nucleoside 2-deoxyribosyltransferase
MHAFIFLAALVSAFFAEASHSASAQQPRLYLASPLGFSASGTNYKDAVLKPALSKLGFEVIDPWTLTSSKKLEAINALPMSKRKAAWQKLNLEIGKQNQVQIDRADLVLAVLDGSDVDSGTAAEVGYAFGQKKKIFGYRSDFRLASDNEGALVNLQVEYFVLASGGKIVRQLSQLPNDIKAKLTNVQPVTSYAQTENAKASRSILDAFTIFPFAIVLALALSEAFKMVISEKSDHPFIDWEKLWALTSFLVLILPFFQGMNRYLLITYGDLAAEPKPHSAYLIVDGAAFLIESALFFAMSRTLGITHWVRFYWVVFILLAIDSAWGFSVRMHSTTEAAQTIEHWTMLNLVTIILLVLLIMLGNRLPRSYMAPALASVAMVIRTIIDYRVSWNFYFPS